jgi:hypothetical protein
LWRRGRKRRLGDARVVSGAGFTCGVGYGRLGLGAPARWPGLATGQLAGARNERIGHMMSKSGG